MNMLDRLIGYVSPSTGLRRAEARATLQQVANLFGSSTGPYDAAKLHRLNNMRLAIVKENEVATSDIEFLRAQSWNLYRNNPSARKIVRTLEAKVIGKGMRPESLAMNLDGTPNVEFRAKAAELWASIQTGFDARGLPGKGGLTMSGLQKLALRSVILSGDTLYRVRPVTPEKQSAHDIPVPVMLQMIDSARLADESELNVRLPDGHSVFRGIELNGNNERVRYWLRSNSLQAGVYTRGDAKPFNVSEIGHLYLEEDIDQYRGTPWFASAIASIRDTGDLNYNILKGSAMAACVVASYKKPTGATRFGLNASTAVSQTSADGTDLTDGDGNTLTKFSPGMLINEGKDGEFRLHSPNQPNTNLEAFVQHLQRGTATAIPGVKGSTITGDYRNSSFSSERSADNDCWPEIQDVQEWFAASYCQPIYETVIRAGMLSGYFDGVVSVEEFQSNPGYYSLADWQGPIALSINPKDDAKAAQARIQSGLTSPQMECRRVNTNWRDILNDVAELYAVAEQKNIPPEFVNSIMGIDTSDVIAAATVATQQTQPEVVNA